MKVYFIRLLCITYPMPTTRIAIIDIGSNTIKLLVADFCDGALSKTVHFETDDTRIGGFLGLENHRISEEAVAASAISVKKLMTQANTFQPDQVAILATSAVREADNRDVFCRRMHEVCQHPVTVLSGQQEAEAIAQGVSCDPHLNHLQEFYMFDQGGGSLEVIHWTPEMIELTSLPLGAIRLFKQYQNGGLGPLSHEQRKAIAAGVDQHWDQVDWLKATNPVPWIGTGGALTLIRSLLAEREGLSFDQSSASLSYPKLSDFLDEIAPLSAPERTTQAHIPISRSDILPAGLTAILQLMKRAETQEVIHSIYNLRYGYAAKLAAVGK